MCQAETGEIDAAIGTDGVIAQLVPYGRSPRNDEAAVGKNGGFILNGDVGIPDEAKPENVKAIAEVVLASNKTV